MTQHRIAWLGLLGIAASTLIAIVAQTGAFLKPFHSSPFDLYWAIFYTVLVLGAAGLWALGKHRILIYLNAWAVVIFVTVVIVFSDNGPAILALIWILLVSLGLGKLVFDIFTPSLKSEYPQSIILQIALGLGMLAMMVFALSWLHLLHWKAVYPAMIVLSIAALPVAYRSYRPAISSWIDHFRTLGKTGNLAEYSAVLSVLVIAILGPALWALSPTIRFDAVVYHLPVPLAYIQNRGMVEITQPMQAYFAQNGEMLYALAMLFTGQPLPGLLHFAAGLVTAGLTYQLGKRIGGRTVGIIAFLVFITLPILYDAGTPFVDFFVSLFSVAAVYAAYSWWQDDKDAWLFISGLMSGLALGTKLTAGTAILPLGIAVAAALFIRHRFSPRAFLGLGRFALPVLVLFAPWLARNFLWTGNPVYPFFSNLFQKSGELASTGEATAPGGSPFIALLKFPWLLTVDSGAAYYPESPGGIAGAVALLALPWMYLFIRNGQSNTRRIGVVLGLLTLLSVLIFFYFTLPTPRVRYMMPTFSILSILAALNIEKGWMLVAESSLRKPFYTLGFTLFAVYLIATRLAFTASGWETAERYPVQVALGLETPNQYLSRSMAVYDAYHYLDNQGSGRHHVISIGNESRLYTNAQVDGIYFSPQTQWLTFSPKSDKELADSLSENGYDYLILDRNMVRDYPHVLPPLVNGDFLQKYARLEFARNNVYLYQLLPSERMVSTEPVVNLAGDSSIENPTAWKQEGAPLVDTSGGHAHTGQSALQAKDGAFLYQDLDVSANQLYTLALWAKADQSDQFTSLQINWMDQNKMFIQVSFESLPASQDWQHEQISVTAPPNTAYARIYARADNGSVVWIDDVCFAQGDRCTP